MKEKICFVIKRYGEDFITGAEFFCKQMAEQLSTLYDVTVLTTCAKSDVTWANHYAEGQENINGVTVFRFKPDYTRDDNEFSKIDKRITSYYKKEGADRRINRPLDTKGLLFLEKSIVNKPEEKAVFIKTDEPPSAKSKEQQLQEENKKKYAYLYQRALTSYNRSFLKENANPEDENTWVRMQGPFCTEIPAFIQANQNVFKTFIFFEYNYYPTVMGLPAVYQKSVLFPFASDTVGLKMEIFKPLFANTKQIIGTSTEEIDLLKKAFPFANISSTPMLMGIAPCETTATEMREKYNLSGEYILCTEEIKTKKTYTDLVSYWFDYCQSHYVNAKLIVVGNPLLHFEEELNILHIKTTTYQELCGLIAGASFVWIPEPALAFAQSALQAFWFSTPLLANQKNVSLAGICARSQAGLYYTNYYEFALCCDQLLTNLPARQVMKHNAIAYAENYWQEKNITVEMPNILGQFAAVCAQQSPAFPLPRKKIAFIVPWFGNKSTSPIDTALKNIMHSLQQQGYAVEVLTTCANETGEWWRKNYYSEDLDTVEDILIRRFIIEPFNPAFDRINDKFFGKKKFTIEDEDTYLCNSSNSDRLTSFIYEHKHDYEKFVFTPFWFGITYFGILAAGGNKSILLPRFLESSEYMKLTRYKKLVQELAGIIYLSSQEKFIAENTYKFSCENSLVAPLTFKAAPKGNANAFREKFSVSSPFILCRIQEEKDALGYDILADFFHQYTTEKELNLKLVVIDEINANLPHETINNNILLFPNLSPEDIQNAYAAAEVFCSSVFSDKAANTLLESWAQGCPVLINEQFPLFKNLVNNANGGLFFSNYFEFSASLSFLLDNDKTRVAIGLSGQNYVLQKSNKDKVIGDCVSFITNKPE